MQKFVMLGALSTVLLMVGCAEKKPATPEEIWQGYCTSIGNAARSITLDRQNGITHKEALDYANKVTDPTTKGFVLEYLEKIYALPDAELKADQTAVQTKFKQEAYEQCLKTPHDPKKMPDYKPF
ncbi:MULTISPECIES: hypothetical protein [Acinetobacter]|uniref:Lipoprotein n=1 Tax=Acinetobacter wuhouensis TaxID=1879050 RepID=A0A3G2T340_9GAMM|nr:MULTISPECIES: hypothetical protein [Acinetobacter]AYO54624.1 hypothetical protein CDG68_13635 [Acinetobacter wuhouensis]RZG48642.1 hypothetical protein EXU28_02400 [Acinetobacter wuhouensis]RZG73047.1 hypothetical protein EXU29_08990 [Acinetobacter wuhouensis]RZG76039.1 hypothetical protein EXE09_08940 [Acinetobacter sp. WCHAc060025]RZG87570.1 hypothetical protein EXE10_04415 [Acinetobacter sp. WCHAc060033]